MSMPEQLYGLVVCGGRSSRMQQDKSLLNYHGQPQRYHLYHLLEQLCERVFISCNATQAGQIKAGYSYITDAADYADAGPIAALLSAFQVFPGSSWLVVACDYPFMTLQELALLTRHSAPGTVAAYNSDTLFYEPLLARYAAAAYPLLLHHYQTGNHSLQQFLRQQQVEKAIFPVSAVLQSADTIADYNKVITVLKNDHAIGCSTANET